MTVAKISMRMLDKGGGGGAGGAGGGGGAVVRPGRATSQSTFQSQIPTVACRVRTWMVVLVQRSFTPARGLHPIVTLTVKLNPGQT